MTEGEIAAALAAAIEDDLVECEEELDAQLVGNALSHLLTRQSAGVWRGVPRHSISKNCQAPRVARGTGRAPSARRLRRGGERPRRKLSACVHRCGVAAVDSARAPLCCSAALLLS